ncbi:hypothetical protein EYF80_037268 [Liparis tanakae]|uniref:Uncharacterized protein n=1 Tax=Liparis tanakae TaxID=230148 RepID=A0A4Z2GGZ1_9TELE|nr:hypothetical protein EYF80_037268 [Liparis tanakae]
MKRILHGEDGGEALLNCPGPAWESGSCCTQQQTERLPPLLGRRSRPDDAGTTGLEFTAHDANETNEKRGRSERRKSRIGAAVVITSEVRAANPLQRP